MDDMKICEDVGLWFERLLELLGFVKIVEGDVGFGRYCLI